MEKNGKLFVPPPRDGSDFKELFKRLTSTGAGRALGSDGLPAGSWTPELLAGALSQIDSKKVGVDPRTVQFWFQDNEKGISTANITRLAKIFGCGDHDAIGEWLIELNESQARFKATRRGSKSSRRIASVVPDALELARPATAVGVEVAPAQSAHETGSKPLVQPHGFAARSEAIFCSGSPLNLPASVFAGVTALGFLSYIIGIHSATYERPEGVVKQVGFLWAPNWTILFMVLLPLFFLFLRNTVVFWKGEGRLVLSPGTTKSESDREWYCNVQASSYSYWAVFLTCVLVAGIFQWIGVDLIPLIKGGGDYAISWGTLATARPEAISEPMSIVFTALAYLYMSLCFYLLFAGLILLYTVVHDLLRAEEALKVRQLSGYQNELSTIGMRVMRGVFRCTVLGILVAVCMKVQSAYLSSNGENIAAWFAYDVSSVFRDHGGVSDVYYYRMPTHFSSLLVALSACVVFSYSFICLGSDSRSQVPLRRMAAVVALLFTGYLLIDAFEGFSILLGIGAFAGIYGLCDPGLGKAQLGRLGNHSVL